MEDLVIQNITLLSKLTKDINLVSEGYKILEIDTDKYDGLTSLKDLEYSIYFTVQECIQYINHSDDYVYQEKLLDLVDQALDSLYEIIKIDIDEDTKEENPNLVYENKEGTSKDETFETIFHLLDDDYYICQKNYQKCSLKKTFLYYLTNFSNALLEADKWLYVTPMDYYCGKDTSSDEEDNCFEDSQGYTDDNDDDKNKKE
tara:strand:+ start:917 stop:1522 length:606 start_codon:yes stop_codon:yes gene_type:complete